jgi:xylulokinase
VAAGTDPLLVGIDAGTSRVRVLAFEPSGRVLAEASRPTPWRAPEPGLAELDADELVATTVAALAELAGCVDRPERVVGLAVASVGEAGVLLDDHDRPLAPVLAWYDPRPSSLREEVVARLSADRLARIAGVTPDPILGVLKLAWHARHTPDAFAAARRWLHLADWLAFRLGGAPATDPSLASRTGLFDLARGTWSEELVTAARVPARLLPEILPSGTRIGTLGPELAAATGLPASCAIGVGGHDHPIGMLATGVVEPGTVLDSMGTAEGLALPLEAPVLDGRLAAVGFNQGLVRVDRSIPYVLTGLVTSAAAIDWCHRLVGPELARPALIEAARAVPPGAHGLLFLPHLRFTSPPTDDPDGYGGTLLGITPETDPARLFRAVLEGVALDWQHMLERLCALLDRPLPERCRAIGGSTKNRLLLEIKAALFGRPIEVAEMAEATALGAALAGGIAAGLWPGLDAARADLALGFARVEPLPGWPPAAARALLAAYAEACAGTRALHRRLAAARGGCWPGKSF